MQTIERAAFQVVHSDSGPSVRDDNRAAVEALMLSIGRLGARVVALTSPTDSQSVRPLSRALCASFASADVKAILIDLTVSAAFHDADPGWNPGTRLSPALTYRDPEGFDQVSAWPTEHTRPLFNNLQHLRRALTEDLGAYRAVILNLAPIINPPPSVPNPLAVARAADGVLLVCGIGRTETGAAVHAVQDLTNAGCKIIGGVLDNTEGVSPGRELAQSLERSRFVPTWMSKRLTPALRNSRFLNP